MSFGIDTAFYLLYRKGTPGAERLNDLSESLELLIVLNKNVTVNMVMANKNPMQNMLRVKAQIIGLYS